MQRFTEEVEILTEEMLRVQRFMRWKAADWEAKAVEIFRSTAMHAEGVKSYAHKQAAFYRGLEKHFNDLWQHVPAYVQQMQNIIDNPSLARAGELDKGKKSGGSKAVEEAPSS